VSNSDNRKLNVRILKKADARKLWTGGRKVPEGDTQPVVMFRDMLVLKIRSGKSYFSK
jgi:hypothetical protein